MHKTTRAINTILPITIPAMAPPPIDPYVKEL